MLHILAGDDDFSVQGALAELKAAIQPAELQDVNITVLEAAQTTFNEVLAACSTVPFLAEKRLVIVEGLLASFEARRRGGSRGPEAEGGSPIDAWSGLAGFVDKMPETTDLVLVDGRITDANPLLRQLRSLGAARNFRLPTGRALNGWIQQHAVKLGAEISPRALAALAGAVGNDTRALDSELRKLSVYCHGRPIDPQDVEALVTYAREANIFAAVDAVVEGKPREALRQVHRLLESGMEPARVMVMIARQLRLIVLAKELRGAGLSQAGIGERLRLSGFPLTKTLRQASGLSVETAAEAFHRLLEADVRVKTGAVDDRTSLDILIGELAIAAARDSNSSRQGVRPAIR